LATELELDEEELEELHPPVELDELCPPELIEEELYPKELELDELLEEELEEELYPTELELDELESIDDELEELLEYPVPQYQSNSFTLKPGNVSRLSKLTWPVAGFHVSKT